MSGLKSEESKIILNGAWHLFVRRNHSLTRKKLIKNRNRMGKLKEQIEKMFFVPMRLLRL
jgi:hypothetical protein